MKHLTRWRIWGLLLAVWAVVPLRAAGQAFSFTAVTSASVVTVTNPVTYTFTLTNNLFPNVKLLNVVVTNAFSAPIVTAGNLISTNQGTLNYGNNTNAIVFGFGDLNFPTNALNFFITALPQTTGVLTNTVTVSIGGNIQLITNLVVAVVLPSTDLSVTNSGFLPAAYVNPAYVGDYVTCAFTVSNAGPGSAAGITLTNTLPAGLAFLGVSPGGPGYTTGNGSVSFNLGALGGGSAATFYATYEPTNAGVYLLTNTVGATVLNDPNLTNNISVAILSVSNYVSTNLLAYTNTTQVLNPQNGFVEQTVLVTNTGTVTVPAVRLTVSGLSTNRLYNVVDTNSTGPFVESPAALAPGKTVALVLEYVVTNRSPFPFTNGQLHAAGVALPSLAPPGTFGFATNANPQIFRLTNSPNAGRMLLQFRTLTGTNYTVVYADNARFTNAQIAQPAVIAAQANVTQWIDYGPPETPSRPTNSVMRFYRIITNP